MYIVIMGGGRVGLSLADRLIIHGMSPTGGTISLSAKGEINGEIVFDKNVYNVIDNKVEIYNLMMNQTYYPVFLSRNTLMEKSLQE